jgi:hypothetical protein
MWIDYNHPDYRRLLLGEGIDTKYMTEAGLHPDLLAKRDIWLPKFYEVKHRSLIIKNVTSNIKPNTGPGTCGNKNFEASSPMPCQINICTKPLIINMTF